MSDGGLKVLLREADLPAGVAELFAPHPPPKRFTADVVGSRDGYNVLAGYEPVGDFDRRWHISVTHEKHLPKWADLVAIGHAVRPGVVFVVGVPPKSWWLNIHPNRLHLWETKDMNLIEQWRAESRGDTPT